MQMVLIVFRNSLESDILKVLGAVGVDAYTNVRKVLGIGDAGTRLDTFEQPGFNSLILTVLDHAVATRLVEALRRFRDESATRQRGATIPLRAFVLPCCQAI